MDFSTLFDAAFFKELLSAQGQASLAEKLIVLGIVWQLMGKQVARHFSSLEKGMAEGFEKLTTAIKEVKDALGEVETSHSKRIDELKLRVEKLERDEPPVAPV